MFHFSASLVPLSLITGLFIWISKNNNSATFIIFATACGFAYLWATYIVPETANLSLEDIDSLFESSAWKEEATVKHQVIKNFDIFFFPSPLTCIFFFFFFFVYIDRTGLRIDGIDSRISRRSGVNWRSDGNITCIWRVRDTLSRKRLYVLRPIESAPREFVKEDI